LDFTVSRFSYKFCNSCHKPSPVFLLQLGCLAPSLNAIYNITRPFGFRFVQLQLQQQQEQLQLSEEKCAPCELRPIYNVRFEGLCRVDSKTTDGAKGTGNRWREPGECCTTKAIAIVDTRSQCRLLKIMANKWGIFCRKA